MFTSSFFSYLNLGYLMFYQFIISMRQSLINTAAPLGQRMVRFKTSSSETPWSRVPLGKRTAPQLVKKLTAFYGTRKFFTVFTRAPHLSLSSARSIQSVPRLSILEDPFHYYVPIYASVLEVVSFPKVFQPKLFMHLACLAYLPHAPSVSFFLMLSPE